MSITTIAPHSMKGSPMTSDNKGGPPARRADAGKRGYHTPAQPLGVVQDDDGLLRLQPACALAGVRKPMLYRMIRAGRMPPLVKIGRGSRLRAGPFKAAL